MHEAPDTWSGAFCIFQKRGGRDQSEACNDSAVVGVGDVLLDGVGLERLEQRLRLRAVLVAGAHGDDVGVGLRGGAVGVLGGERVADVQTGGQRIVCLLYTSDAADE